MCGLWVWSCCPHLNLFESIFERTYRLMMNEIQRRVQLSRVIINIFTWRNGCPSSPTWDVILMNEKYVSIQLCNKHACCTWNLYLPWKDESAISSNFSVQVELSNWRVHWRSITLGADMTTRVSCFLSSSLRLDLRHTHLVMTIYYLYAKELSDTTAQRIIGAPSMVILLGHDECEPRVVGTENHVSVVTETVSSTQTTTIRHSTHRTIFGHVLLKLTFHTKAISHRCSIVSRNGSTEDCHLSFSGKKKN